MLSVVKLQQKKSLTICAFFKLDGLPENIPSRKREFIRYSFEKPTGIAYRHVNLPSGQRWQAELE
jgi:hypothetical protein